MDVRRFTISANGKASCVCNVLTESEAMAVLQSVAQRPTAAKTSNTQWSVVYNLTRGTYTLCVGRNYNTPVSGSVE
ncbi:MAG: hypothetical protein MJZ70_05580 [Bacteroidales bacterium]|nr:hypothetical protein [Bacteroidales bacterium]